MLRRNAGRASRTFWDTKIAANHCDLSQAMALAEVFNISRPFSHQSLFLCANSYRQAESPSIYR